jgi:hypothetical protein
MTVATMSETMKVLSMTYGGSGAYHLPTRLITIVMIVYMAAEKKMGAMTTKKYWITKKRASMGPPETTVYEQCIRQPPVRGRP